MPELAQDPRYATNSARIEHLPALRALLTGLFPTRTRTSWTEAFDASGVPWGPIHTMDEVFAHPQVQHRGLLQVAEHPVMGRVPMVRNPMLAGHDGPLVPPPLLGEHSAAN
ncbi:Formyl-coenzyme A transferase [compost metagenome]